MQLKRLYIKDYKILKDFTIEFPILTSKKISLLVGENGSGKSTILEALAEIFNCYFLSKKSSFDFVLEYYADIEFESSKNTGSKNKEFFIKLNGSKGKVPELAKLISEQSTSDKTKDQTTSDGKRTIEFIPVLYEKLLPDKVIVYYSGQSKIMEKLSEAHSKSISDSFRGGEKLNKYIYYYRSDHFSLILLSLLSFQYGDVPGFLKSKINIEDFESIKIFLKEPYWSESGSLIQNFWGAEGRVRSFLDFICHSFSEKTNYEFFDYDIIRNSIDVEEIGDDRLSITINSKEALFVIKDYLGKESLLFEMLFTLHYDDLLDDIDIKLIKSVDNVSFHHNNLSEGEQQTLIIKGLTELMGDGNTLFLFDEPDTYLHPQWQREFLSEVDSNVSNSNNYFLVTSHSPSIVSGVEQENLFILRSGELINIPFESYGQNVESILTDFFNVEGVRNKYVEKLLEEVHELVRSKKIDSSEFKSKFNELKNIIRPSAPEIVNINLEISKSRKK